MSRTEAAPKPRSAKTSIAASRMAWRLAAFVASRRDTRAASHEGDGRVIRQVATPVRSRPTIPAHKDLRTLLGDRAGPGSLGLAGRRDEGADLLRPRPAPDDDPYTNRPSGIQHVVSVRGHRPRR
jgi:hypothetical protein